jgi:hypothetical protein
MPNSSFTGSSGDQIKRDAEILYQHWLDLRKQETPQGLVNRFHNLFIDGTTYPDSEIVSVRDRIILADSRWAGPEFLNILNRCCYILINHWWLQADGKADLRNATNDLVGLFQAPPTTIPYTRPTQYLRQLTRQFTTTPQYELLQRRAWVAGGEPKSDQTSSSAPRENRAERIRDVVHRYPFLYPDYLHNEHDSGDTTQLAVKQLQQEREQKFEHDLLWYATNRNLEKNNHAHRQVENPTLLSVEQLEGAIKQFTGKVQGAQNYRESASGFLQSVGQVSSYRDFKGDLHDYLTQAIQYSVNPKYGRHRLNDWLADHLSNIQPQRDHLRPSGSLLVGTCGQLLDALVNPHSAPNHLMFVDMVTNLGATFTIGFILKLVLLCRSVPGNLAAIKAYVAKRFAMMFKAYETRTRDEITWLTECLDNWMVASTIHFGQASFSKWNDVPLIGIN